MVRYIDRLIELDEQETARQRERVEFLALTAAIIDALPDAVVVTNAAGEIRMVNDQTEKMFGYHRTDLIHMRVEQLLPDTLRERHARYRAEYNKMDLNPHARTMGVGVQLMARRSDGTLFPADIMLVRMVVPHSIYNLALIRHGARPTPNLSEHSNPDAGLTTSDPADSKSESK